MTRVNFFYSLTLLNFIFAQRDVKAHVNVCPCIRAASGGACVGYNPKYQAASLEEAVINFIDLTALDPSDATNVFGQKPSKSPCKSVDCVSCFQALTERLTAQWTSSESGTSGLGLGQVSNSPAPNAHSTLQCKRLMRAEPSLRIRSTRDLLNSSSLLDREKRESQPPSMGQNTPIDCSADRGDSVGDNSAYMGLCNLCWSMRTLPNKYFPRYINEIACHPTDKGCLNGWGKCRERYRSVDVWYNSGTDASPKWQQNSVNSPVSCECEVLSGSGLHNFVSH